MGISRNKKIIEKMKSFILNIIILLATLTSSCAYDELDKTEQKEAIGLYKQAIDEFKNRIKEKYIKF